MTVSRVQILLPLPLSRLFDYRLEGEGAPGTLVRAPFASRRLIGCVWKSGAGAPTLAAAKIRRAEALDHPARLEPSFLAFIDWMAQWTCNPRGAILKAALASLAASPPVLPPRIVAEAEGADRLSPRRREVLDILRREGPMTLRQLGDRSGCSPSVPKALIEGGWARRIQGAPDHALPNPNHEAMALSNEQSRAAAALTKRRAGGGFHVSLLDGVTGSGKTLVYLEAVADVLRRGGQALVLVPEIALSERWLETFEQRFGAPALAWHSSLPSAARRRCWHAVATGRFPVVVGARSALLLPFQKLSLIIVDEEHDATFKQDEGLIYHARDMAIARGRSENVPVILASATPSLETLENVDRGKYQSVVLPSRFHGARLPKVELIDMTKEGPMIQRWISPSLEEAVGRTLDQGRQALLFLNRRGYAPIMICRGCSHRLQGEKCSNALVYHRQQNVLLCHHCAHRQPMPERCPACGEKDSFRPCGPGVERLEEETARRFPQARRCVISSDCGRDSLIRLLDRIADHHYDIIIGTQIIAKGHHFPHLHLVGIIDADFGLAGGDLRAAEKTFQLMHQVTGRAGRSEIRGKAMIQTYDVASPLMQALASGERERFFAEENALRRQWKLPPHSRLAALIVSGRDHAGARDTARLLGQRVPASTRVRVLGPAPAPLFILRGRARWRFLVKSEVNVRLSGFMRRWSESVDPPKGVRLQIDIDPFHFH